VILLVALLACRPGDDTGDTTPITYPRLLAESDDKAAILDRLGDEPYDAILDELDAQAALPLDLVDDPMAWDHDRYGRNASIAQSAAMRAWLFDDAAAADVAIAALDDLATDFENNDTWDVNIRMPGPLIGFGTAIDLLRGTDFYTDEQAADHIGRLVTVTDAFYDQFVEDDVRRQAILGFAQNNHPIRTATAIGFVALFYPESPDAEAQADWAISELDTLWGPDGRYVQPDGGVSEGPFYYGFALAPSLALFLAMDRAVPASRTFHRDCRNRQDVDPWIGQECIDGEAFQFENPLHGELFASTVTWWIGLQTPEGLCPPLADAYFNPLNGAALLGGPTGDGAYRWSWERSARPREMTHGQDLIAWHLANVDPEVAPTEPAWTTRILPDAGTATIRSGWDSDARWLLVLGQHGAARKTLHDQVDGLSFSMAAYGEYLLTDPGYYKPAELSLPRTAQSASHNTIRVDGKGAPDKGLLTDWGDADAFLENGYDGDRVDYVEARQDYEGVRFERSVAMIRGRWFVVGDRLATDSTAAREFAWRLGGNAGADAGGTFAVDGAVATWERPLAGVRVHLASTAPGLSLVEPPLRDLTAPHVHEFDLARTVGHHAVVDGVVDAVEPGFLAVLAPYRVGDVGADGPLAVTPIDQGPGVVAYTVTTADALDLVLLRSPGSPTSFTVGEHAIATDGEMIVVSLSGAPLAVLVRGGNLTVDGVVRATGSPSTRVVSED